MVISELNEIFERCDIRKEKQLSGEATFKELGVDSLDLATIAYELEEITGHEIRLNSGMTINETLAAVN